MNNWKKKKKKRTFLGKGDKIPCTYVTPSLPNTSDRKKKSQHKLVLNYYFVGE